LTRPVGRPPKKPIVLYYSFRYQAASWDIPRRVVAKIEWYAEELFPKIGFIVTNLRWKSSNVVKFYNKRGTAEQWIKEGKYALNWTRLSCHDFVDNQVRLQLFALAYNLGNFLRRLALPKSVKQWSLRTLRDKLVKIGAKVISHSRYVIFQMAEVAVSRILFREILDRIRQLRFLTIPARPGWCVELLKTGFWDGGQRSRCAKIVGKSGFSAYLLDFVGVFCEKTLWFRKNIVDNEMKLRYYETWSLQECFSELYMGNPGCIQIPTVSQKNEKVILYLFLEQ